MIPESQRLTPFCEPDVRAVRNLTDEHCNRRHGVRRSGHGSLSRGFGLNVVCIDADAARIGMLRAGELPFYEPGLADLVHRNVAAGRLEFYEGPSPYGQFFQDDISYVGVGLHFGL